MIFRIAISPEDYAVLAEFQQNVEGKQTVLGYPVVYGISEHGDVLGFTGTQEFDGKVVSGPTVIDPVLKPRLPYAKLQIAAHEAALRQLGVKEYYFSVEKTNHRMFQVVSAEGLVPYAQDDEVFWYKRELTNAGTV